MTTLSNKGNGMGSVTKAGRHLAHDVGAGASDVGSDFARLKDEIVAAITQAFSSARHGAADKAAEVYGAARKRGEKAVHSLEHSVASHPLASVSIAAGAGMLLGMFLLRRHRARAQSDEGSAS